MDLPQEKQQGKLWKVFAIFVAKGRLNFSRQGLKTRKRKPTIS
jgi:hypothetical protein